MKLAARGVFLKGGRDLAILRSIQVYEVMDRNYETIEPTTPLRDVIHKVESTRESYYMVVDSQNHLRGVISFQDIRGVLSTSGIHDLVIADDIAHKSIISVTPEDNLQDARRKFAVQDLKLLPVVDSQNENRILGVLRYDEMMTVYNKRLIETLSD